MIFQASPEMFWHRFDRKRLVVGISGVVGKLDRL
jgi:hypothetical protein